MLPPEETISEILQLLENNKYLAAHELFLKCQGEIETSEKTLLEESESVKCDAHTDSEHSPSDNDNHDNHKQELFQWVTQMKQQLSTHAEKLSLMQERMKDIRAALEYQDHNEQWILGATHFGIHTYYQLDESDNTLIIKMEGDLDDLPLFEQCAVIHEIDLFHTWIPFCSDAKMVDKIGPAELITYMNIGLPIMSRDFAMHVYAADCLHEHDKILIIGHSIDEYEKKPLPLKNPGWFHDRMIVKEFKVMSELRSATRAKSTIVAHINPQAALPQALINFIMKNLAGLLLYLFQKQAHKVVADPNCEHAKRIHRNTEFYMGWILPKFRDFCEFKGWEQPVIPSLGEDGVPH